VRRSNSISNIEISSAAVPAPLRLCACRSNSFGNLRFGGAEGFGHLGVDERAEDGFLGFVASLPVPFGVLNQNVLHG
jgi:hypothetical protein